MRGILLPPFFAQADFPKDEIFDIVVLQPKEPIWPLLLYLVVALLIAAALAVLAWYLMRSRKGPAQQGGAFAKAERRIRDLERRHDELSPNHFSLELSDTLKDFLSETFADPVRFETTEEFLARIGREETRLPPAAQHELREFLNSAEEVKFGNTPGSEARTLPLLHRAKSLLQLCQAINAET